MRDYTKFYIDGRWVEPTAERWIDVVDPATEAIVGRVSVATAADVDQAVTAARRAFTSWSQTSRGERIEVLERILAEYKKRSGDIAKAITEEMGAPAVFAQRVQAGMGGLSFKNAIATLKEFLFEERRGATQIVKEPIGVCGLITPWNYPINQVAAKLAPALAVGCTMVLKPSEVAPFSTYLLAEVLDAAGVPPGVFNLVNGDGPTTGSAISRHPQIDMVSFTGSTRAGVEIAISAAPTVKRVTQELGGKSPNIILEDADFATAVTGGVNSVMMNSGQTCSAPTRMLVPFGKMEEALGIAKAAAEANIVGDPNGNANLGPVASEAQWHKVQGLIQQGIDEGAALVTGGLGRPEGLDKGFFVKPTVFANVTNDMAIAREEVFGPVLAILGYGSTAEAIEIANDTDYGLAAYISGKDQSEVKSVASKLRAGQVLLNGAFDVVAPFGGYKHSGNGREMGEHGFEEFLEVKAIVGYGAWDAA